MPAPRTIARCLLPLLLALAGGCATSGYIPPRYQAEQNRFGAIRLTAGKKIYVCPAIDRLTTEDRERLDSSFTAWEYVTDAVEKELRASGLAPVRATIAFGPGFDSLQQALREKAAKSEKAVYLGIELLRLTPNRWTLDAKLFDPAGAVLFEKRGLCMVFDNRPDTQEIAHMALRQILADPRFQNAIR